MRILIICLIFSLFACTHQPIKCECDCRTDWNSGVYGSPGDTVIVPTYPQIEEWDGNNSMTLECTPETCPGLEDFEITIGDD